VDRTLASVLVIVGAILMGVAIWLLGWRVGWGVFLMVWANNLGRDAWEKRSTSDRPGKQRDESGT
jgi:hypothetical protein